MPVFAASFFIDFAYNRFLLGKKDVGLSVRDNELLGPHSDLVCFECKKENGSVIATVTRYFWSHPGLQPYGNSLPTQCPRCHGLRTWGVAEKTENKILLKCKAGCGKTLDFSRPSGAKFVSGRYEDDGRRGQWLKITIDWDRSICSDYYRVLKCKLVTRALHQTYGFYCYGGGGWNWVT